MSTIASPRPTRAILADVLAELRDREARLSRVAAELTEVRAAIKAVSKLVPRPPAPAAPAAAIASTTPEYRSLPAEEQDRVVLDAIRRSQPIASSGIALATRLSPGALKASIARLRDAGSVTMVGEKAAARYWLTADAPRPAIAA